MLIQFKGLKLFKCLKYEGTPLIGPRGHSHMFFHVQLSSSFIICIFEDTLCSLRFLNDPWV